MDNIEHLKLPSRKGLPHSVPVWVSDDARHFISINCKRRGVNQLASRPVADAILESISVYEKNDIWFVHIFVIMPDHLHFIASFNLHKGISSTIAAWKAFHARRLDIDWQSSYFEHRIRSDEEFRSKAQYIRENPVRQNLVNSPEDWPYQLDRQSHAK